MCLAAMTFNLPKYGNFIMAFYPYNEENAEVCLNPRPLKQYYPDHTFSYSNLHKK